ncbi:MAG: hypothetical protein V4850_36580 [Myxococcota bacterium]
MPSQQLLHVHVCSTCVEDLDLLRFVDEEWPKWSDAAHSCYSQLNAAADFFCAECVAAVQLAFARTQGMPDPFIPYERTVTSQQREVLDQLVAGLERAFAFRESIVEPGRSALVVHQGALTHPLSITISYVTDPAEQDAILGWIDAFLADTTHRQYRAEFYAFEDWKVEESGGACRGPERAHEAGPPRW